ncbi:MAG: MFS transporter [Cellulosimicrobium cellulans]
MNPLHPDDPDFSPPDNPRERLGNSPRRPRHPKEQGIGYSFRAFRHSNYRLFWFGALASNTGSWLSNLTVPYVLYSLTGSVLWVALAAVAQFVPGVVLGPLGGSLADRYDRRKVIIYTQSGLAVVALLMWANWASGLQDPALLLWLIALVGVLNGLNMPAWQSFVSDLVPREDLLSAVTLNSLQFNAARSLGPAIAGILLAGLGPSWAFFLNAVSFLFVIAALLIVTNGIAASKDKPDRGVFGQFLQALNYVRTQPGIVMGILISVMIGLLGNPLFQLTVVFAEDIFRVGPTGLGLLNAALGVGAVIAAPLVSGWSRFLPTGLVAQWGLTAYGLGLIAFGLTDHFVLALVSLVLVGASFLSVISGVNTSIQLIVTDDMRGRVFAVRHMFFTASMPAGAVLQGLLADFWGVQATVILAGSVMLAGVLALSLIRGRSGFRGLDDRLDAG